MVGLRDDPCGEKTLTKRGAEWFSNRESVQLERRAREEACAETNRRRPGPFSEIRRTCPFDPLEPSNIRRLDQRPPGPGLPCLEPWVGERGAGTWFRGVRGFSGRETPVRATNPGDGFGARKGPWPGDPIPWSAAGPPRGGWYEGSCPAAHIGLGGPCGDRGNRPRLISVGERGAGLRHRGGGPLRVPEKPLATPVFNPRPKGVDHGRGRLFPLDGQNEGGGTDVVLSGVKPDSRHTLGT